MNEVYSTNSVSPVYIKDTFAKVISGLDSHSILVVGGMLCVSLVAIVGFVSLSGSEMSLNSSGLTITQKKPA